MQKLRFASLRFIFALLSAFPSPYMLEYHAGCKNSAPFHSAPFLHSKRRLVADLRPDAKGKNSLPAFHPDEKHCKAQRGTRTIFLPERVPAHVGPEVEDSKYKGHRSNVIDGKVGWREA